MLVKILYRSLLRSVEDALASGYSNYNRRSFIPISKNGWAAPIERPYSHLMALVRLSLLLLDSPMMDGDE